MAVPKAESGGGLGFDSVVLLAQRQHFRSRTATGKTHTESLARLKY